MGSLAIVSGVPGAGKTTLTVTLAASRAAGLHLPSDVFYTFPAHPLDPTTPESHAQNVTVVRALGATCRAFVAGGYDVFLDGVLGPWLLDPLLEETRVSGVDYVVLRADPSVAVDRVHRREGSGRSPAVRQMNTAFADLGPRERHVVDTTDLTPEATRSRVEVGLAAGRFRL